MIRSLLLLLTAVVLAAGPASAQSRAEMRDRIERLCDGDATCAAAVRDAVRDRCGTDQACLRTALDRAIERRADPRSQMADVPPALQDLIRDLVGLAAARSGRAERTAEPALGDNAVATLESLPQRAQNQIRRRCGTDPDCIRRAIDEGRSRREGRSAPDEPVPNPSATDDSSDDADEDADASSPAPQQGRPRGGRLNTDVPGQIVPGERAEGAGERLRAGQAAPGASTGSGSAGHGSAGSGSAGSGSAGSGSAGSGSAGFAGRRATAPAEDVLTDNRDAAVSPGTFAQRLGDNDDDEPDDDGEPHLIVTPDRKTQDDEPGPIVYGAGRTTWVSGSQDDRVRNLMAPEGGWLVGIRMGEWSDDPCSLDAYFATEAWATSRSTQDDEIRGGELEVRFDQCGETGESALSAHLLSFAKTSNSFTYDYPLALYGDDEVPHAINGIQVCQRESNDLLKGLRILGGTLDLDDTPVDVEQIMTMVPDISTGGLREARALKVFERPNCNAWHTERSCPEGQVATGVEVHYNTASSGRAQITGLALHCAELTR
jgi:hypothetical protein